MTSPITRIAGEASTGAWVAYAGLNNPVGSNTGFCSDSTGVSKDSTAPDVSAYACP